MSAERDRPVVIASNRGPLSYRLEDGEPVGRRGGGGLVSGLAPLVEDGRATWIAAALSDGDRAAVRAGITTADGLSAHLLDLDPEDHRLAYDLISNETLWFVHHGLFDLTRSPAYDGTWWDAWAAYRRVNERFAEAVVELSPDGAVVLVQDYHLTLLAPTVRAARPDLSLVHFHHTPFAGPDGMRVLPPAARAEMLGSLAAHDACGFHTEHWCRELPRRARPLAADDGAGTNVFASSLSSDADGAPAHRGVRRSATRALRGARRADRRPAADRPRRPHGAVEEHRARLRRLRPAAGAAARPARSGDVPGLLLPVA